MFLFLNVSKFILSGMEEVGIEHEKCDFIKFILPRRFHQTRSYENAGFVAKIEQATNLSSLLANSDFFVIFALVALYSLYIC
jgi:hypothetical protein